MPEQGRKDLQNASVGLSFHLLDVPCHSGGGGWVKALTNAHDDKEAREKSPKIDHTAACRLHEVIAAGCPSAEPVGERRDDVGCDDEQGEEVAVEGGGQDDEEEAYRQNLCSARVSRFAWQDEDARACAWGGRTKDRPMMVLMPAMTGNVGADRRIRVGIREGGGVSRVFWM